VEGRLAAAQWLDQLRVQSAQRDQDRARQPHDPL